MATHGLQKLPAPIDPRRVETGAVQFGDDWPGLFVRGDTAIVLMNRIRHLSERIGDSSDPVVSLALIQLNHFADIIDREVRVR
jgi:hypothetical protein